MAVAIGVAIATAIAIASGHKVKKIACSYKKCFWEYGDFLLETLNERHILNNRFQNNVSY
jgi:hypothetical protein